MRIRLLPFAATLLFATGLHAQQALESVVVETYYVSDDSDATDVTGGGLSSGSVTYRVFVDLATGCYLKTIYGNVDHPLEISSTAYFFNQVDRGKTFGHEIQGNRLDENVLALDSWLSFGAASNAHYGILKADDVDGSIIGGTNNDGGSTAVAGGLLVNDAANAGIPLTTADGLVPGTGLVPPGFIVTGDNPDQVFLDATVSSSYLTDSVTIQSSTGVQGPTADNRILIAQLTTTGALTFHLNIEVIDTSGNVLKYVAGGDTVLADETVFGLLNYPPECGCTDPNFLEYDPAAGCDDGSCQTAIVFGCLDTLACNYDPQANFNVLALCCYGPGSCNGLDITIVCPEAAVEEWNGYPFTITTFPNPVRDRSIVRIDGRHASNAGWTLQDLSGRVVTGADLGVFSGHEEVLLDLSGLARGAYLLRVMLDGEPFTRTVVKE